MTLKAGYRSLATSFQQLDVQRSGTNVCLLIVGLLPGHDGPTAYPMSRQLPIHDEPTAS